MISLDMDMAIRLKEAGLTYDNDYGHFFWDLELNTVVYLVPAYLVEGGMKRYVFAPRLDQLLGEIEQRGWLPKLSWVSCHDRVITCYSCSIETMDDAPDNGLFYGTMEEAAAQALLWIMTRECKQPEPEEPLTQEEMAKRALEYLT